MNIHSIFTGGTYWWSPSKLAPTSGYIGKLKPREKKNKQYCGNILTHSSCMFNFIKAYARPVSTT